MPTEDNRQARLLHRFGFHRDIFEVPVAALEARFRFGPQKFHNLHGFGEARHPPLAHVAEEIFVRAEMSAAETDAHDRASVTHHIERRIGFRQLQWIS